MTKDLFIKYMHGSCSEEEFKELLIWIESKSMTTSGHAIVKEIWNEFEPTLQSVDRLKYSRILDKIHHQININENQGRKIIHRKHRLISLLTKVAAILLFPVLLLLIYTNLPQKWQLADNVSQMEIEASSGSRMHVTLEDGTVVWLNSGSKLSYPYKFMGNERKVHLTGEAYFEVAHNQKIPFIVATDQLLVKAIGTVFNVNAYSGDNIVETVLIEGKVILYGSNEEKIKALSPNECIKYNLDENKYTIDSGNTSKYVAWKNGFLVFKNDLMTDVIRKLERWYNVDIVIEDDEVKELTYTATFTNETISQVFELMTLAAPVNYEFLPREKLSDGSYAKPKIIIRLRKY